MMLRLNVETRIEDMQNHPARLIDELRVRLAAGAEVRPDARRKSFYEVEAGTRVFYIHVCPNGKVLLLAVWDKIRRTATCPDNAKASVLAFC